MKKNRTQIQLMALVALLAIALPTASSQAAPLAAYPPDPAADIPWSGGTGGVADIQSAFNNARSAENTQLGTSVPMMTLPGQSEWDSMSKGHKALWLINRERIDRGLLPLEDVETNVTDVAQTYADYLITNNAWGHSADGRTPWERLEDNLDIGACHDFLNVAENLAVFVTTESSIPLPIERSIYMWMYDDSGSAWGHRHAILWYPYNNNNGSSGSEGFLGIGWANGADYQGPFFPETWNYAELVVMNVFDPCANFSPPRVNSIVRAGASPTSAANVDFTVTFSESVTGVDTVGPSFNDFTLTTSSVSGAAVSGVSGSGSLYTVTVDTGSGDGTVRLDLIDNNSIFDGVSNPLGGEGAGNGDFTTGEVYIIDRTPPTVSSTTRLNVNPSATLSVSFQVTFSEPVTGVEAADFALSTAGPTGAFISNVIGSGAARTVVVNTGVGDGTIRLDVLDDDSITDAASNPLTAGFASGEEYSIDKPDLPPPALRSPRSNAITNLTTPTLRWTNVRGGSTYEIEVATDDTFTGIVDGGFVSITSFSPAAPLGEDVYYWRVRARTAGGQPGAWSPIRTFTIDTSGPAAPALTSPSDGAIIRTAIFRWQAASGAVSYEFQLDDNSDFSSPVIASIVRGASRRLSAMPGGLYYWRVRAKDALGNWGAWSTVFTVNIAGY